jgi:hypothetical protein
VVPADRLRPLGRELDLDAMSAAGVVVTTAEHLDIARRSGARDDTSDYEIITHSGVLDEVGRLVIQLTSAVAPAAEADAAITEDERSLLDQLFISTRDLGVTLRGCVITHATQSFSAAAGARLTGPSNALRVALEEAIIDACEADGGGRVMASRIGGTPVWFCANEIGGFIAMLPSDY